MTRHKKIIWLLGLIVLLFMMISVGGVTRLTKSGLSITQWSPVTGILPPLTQKDWLREFTLYQKSAEYKYHNSHFEINDYKRIFWWEYIHRLLGRIIFLVAVALSYVFWRNREISGVYATCLPALIAFQGVIGWLMVRTGLNHRPSVSHYMLAIHFILALLTLMVVYFPLAKMRRTISVRLSKRVWIYLIGLGLLLFLQIVYGGFTSGLKAGLYYSTFPLMKGSFFPPAHGWSMEPLVRNLFENPVTVQWIHRWLGITTGIFLIFPSWHLFKHESRSFKRSLIHLISIVIVQIILGILTLVFKLPIILAVAHQFMAALTVLAYCNIIFRVQRNCV